MKKVTMSSNLTKVELLNYFNYLDDIKVEVFNFCHKLKNDRGLKISALVEDDKSKIHQEVTKETNILIRNLEQISNDCRSLLNSLPMLRQTQEELNSVYKELNIYRQNLSDAKDWIDYTLLQINKLINT